MLELFWASSLRSCNCYHCSENLSVVVLLVVVVVSMVAVAAVVAVVAVVVGAELRQLITEILRG